MYSPKTRIWNIANDVNDGRCRFLHAFRNEQMQFSRTTDFFNITVDTVMETAIKVLLLNWASGTKIVQKSLTF